MHDNRSDEELAWYRAHYQPPPEPKEITLSWSNVLSPQELARQMAERFIENLKKNRS